MSSETAAAPDTSPVPRAGGLRPRLTGTPVLGRVVAEAALSPSARGGLERISGGRAPEELVVLAAALSLVAAGADAGEQAVLHVQRPDGGVACPVDVTAAATPADLVLAVDGLVKAGAPQPHGAEVLVASAAVAEPEILAPLTVTLLAKDADGGRALRVDMDRSRYERWFAEVLVRVLDHALSAFERPRDPLADWDPMPNRAPIPEGGGWAGDVAAWEIGDDPAPEPGTLLSGVEAHAAAHSDDIAVVDVGGAELTYGQLLAAATRVARQLRLSGVRDGSPVVVIGPKSWRTLAVVLGTLRAGAAYVPLDPGAPGARLDAMLRDLAPAAVVLDPGVTLPPGATPPDCPVLSLAAVAGEVGDAAVDVDVPPPGPEDTAYVIYTSGSTGRPKGVVVRHGAVHPFLRWRHRYQGLGRDTRMLLVPSLFFDSSVADVFAVLASGGRLVLLEERHRLDVQKVCALVAGQGVTHATFVPSLYQLVLDGLAAHRDTLRTVVVAGEAVPPELVARHLRLMPGVRLVNEYGPTENSVGSTALDHGSEPPFGHPIGRPVAGTVVQVLDSRGRRVPPGFAGEICLSGPRLADGYWRSPAATAKAFRAAPRQPGGRRYHTGDRGWWRPDGVLEFLGRADAQVKVRGNRIEIGDVEAALAALPGVEAVAVVPVGNGVVTEALVAYVSGPAAEDVHAVRERVRDTLPAPMIPATIVGLAAMPLTVNGKADRGELGLRAAADLRCGPFLPVPGAAPADPAEAPGTGTGTDGSRPDLPDLPDLVDDVRAVFAGVLNVDSVGTDEDFFAAGGDSLLALGLVMELAERLDVYVEVDDFFATPTPAGVCKMVRTSREGA
ncbi:non-ribosomal peptide synthetase [Streptomyces sp. RTd22]|uniref:non-ribosomal peptide synthetase n=1 Tax=Streptomyces sp. RTd22 TaxID=1841249 RepID=UPI000AC5C5CA|nr:non-ribosomal peptide synthetase [Streptomyces sp. RTd22]